MVIGQIAKEVFRTGIRGLYRAINIQDKAIDRAWSLARFNRSVRRGVRHGAGIGAATGYFISDQFKDDIEDFGFKAPNGKSTKTRPFNKTYRRPTGRYCLERSTDFYSGKGGRRSYRSKRF